MIAALLSFFAACNSDTAEPSPSSSCEPAPAEAVCSEPIRVASNPSSDARRTFSLEGTQCAAIEGLPAGGTVSFRSDGSAWLSVDGATPVGFEGLDGNRETFREALDVTTSTVGNLTGGRSYKLTFAQDDVLLELTVTHRGEYDLSIDTVAVREDTCAGQELNLCPPDYTKTAPPGDDLFSFYPNERPCRAEPGYLADAFFQIVNIDTDGNMRLITEAPIRVVGARVSGEAVTFNASEEDVNNIPDGVEARVDLEDTDTGQRLSVEFSSSGSVLNIHRIFETL